MKKIIFSIFASLAFFSVIAQTPAASVKAFTKTGKVYFSATSSMEKIEATTNKATAVIDLTAGKMEVKLLVKSFHFEKALMEEHFNENYLESGKYPNSTFVGDITDAKSVNLAKDGSYKVNIKGKLTMHNVTKDVATTGTIVVKGGALVSAQSDLTILVADYGIAIPGAVKDKIAKEAKLKIDLALQPLK